MNVKRVLRRAIFSPDYPKWLLGIFAVWFGVWAIGPPHPKDFVLEHLFTVAFLVFLCWSHGRFRLSNLSYTAIFVFLCLHVVGAHYTYSLVPYADWWQSLTGIALEGRNHYDRLVHFLYGLLVTPAAVELFAHYGRYSRAWAFLFPCMFMAGHAVIYELIEFAAAIVFGGDLGQAYLGTQGDIWDGQKDMAFALAGTTIMLVALALAGRLPVRARQSQ